VIPEVRRGRSRTVFGLLSLLCAVVLFALSTLHGPVLLSLASSHGLDLGDLVCLPFIALGLWLLSGGPVHAGVLRARRVFDDHHLDTATVGLLMSGAGLVLVWLFLEVSSSDPVPHAGVLPGAIAASGLVILAVALSEPGTAVAVFGAPLAVVLGVLGLGLLIDATDGPAGAVVGPTLLAAILAVMLGRRRPAVGLLLGATALLLVVVDITALVDAQFLREDRELSGGGLGRTAALGIVLLLVGLSRLFHEAGSSSDRQATSRPPGV